MPDDPKKSKSKPKPKAAGGGAPPPPGGGPPGMDPGAGGPPMGMPPIGGAAMGGDPAMGAPPPMPGTGIDPYAALMGQVSASPMSMPMGQGMNGQVGMPGGLGAGMGLGMEDGTPGGQPFGPPNDMITSALMAQSNPTMIPPEAGSEYGVQPEGMGGEQMSMAQILELLTMMQAGIPKSGLDTPMKNPNVGGGVMPGEQFGAAGV